MKRLHIGATVENLEASIAFYSTLFDAEPTVRRDDYAKWMLEDPRVNFSITMRPGGGGVDHLGIQVDGDEELEESRNRLAAADLSLHDVGEITCCYAKSKKHWVIDPDGVPWETFATRGLSEVYGQDTLSEGALSEHFRKRKEACCQPAAEVEAEEG